MQKIYSFLEKYKYWIFGVAILLAIGLRVWDFSGGMLLKGDQIRDAIMSARSFENGLGELPLLGPRAGGTNLRLGPVFYYLQSGSAFIFNSLESWVLAFPNLVFSILAVPVFFLLVRLYFPKFISLGLTTLFSFSFLAFEYSRFTWNPNSIPFFILLFLYAWIVIFSSGEKKNWKWFLLLGLSFAIASQLHFTSFIALVLFSVLFVVFKWKMVWSKIGWKNLAIFLSTIIFFYIPVILSDILNNGDNLQLFFKSIGTKQSSHNLLQNLTKEFYYFGKYFFRLAFGYFGSNKLAHFVGLLLLAGGFIWNILLLRKEEDRKKKSFLFTLLLWTITFFLLYIPLAYDIDQPRFFLPLLFLPYIYLGLAWQLNFKMKKLVFALLATLMLAGNAAGSFFWLSEFTKAQNGKLDAKDTIILKTKKDRAWWTWGMIKKAATIMSEECKGGAIYYYSPKRTEEFSDVFDWAFKLNGEQRPYGFMKKMSIDKKGCIFTITKQSYDLNVLQKKVILKTIGSSGDILISKLDRSSIDEEVAIKIIEPITVVSDEIVLPQNHQRAYWKDVIEYFKK